MTCLRVLAVALPIMTLGVRAAPGQEPVITPDLAKIAAGDGWDLQGRTAVALVDGDRSFIRLSEALGSGLARVAGLELANGVIEVAIRGKNVPQRSFVGVAFHGIDDQTYEAVYFRPFNFTSDEPERRDHGVQYVAHPVYTWNKLRAEHPMQYEQPVVPPPDPDGWFTARVVLRDRTVSVYVDGAREPSLVVERLAEQATGWVGLFVGSGSGGDFADLRITPGR